MASNMTHQDFVDHFITHVRAIEHEHTDNHEKIIRTAGNIITSKETKEYDQDAMKDKERAKAHTKDTSI